MRSKRPKTRHASFSAPYPLRHSLPFALSWWALSFPLAALSIASFLFARIEHSAFHQAVGLVVLVILVLVVLGLVLRTALAMLRGEICRPE